MDACTLRHKVTGIVDPAAPTETGNVVAFCWHPANQWQMLSSIAFELLIVLHRWILSETGAPA
jgi:hypothetical protein